MKYNAISEKTAIKRSWTVRAQWYLSESKPTDNPNVQTAEWINFPEPLELTCVATNPYSAAYAFAKKFLREYGFHNVKVRVTYHHSKWHSITAENGARCDVEVTENE